MAKQKKPSKRAFGTGTVKLRKDGRYEGKILTQELTKGGNAKYKSFYGKTEAEVTNKMDEYRFMHNLSRVDPTKITLEQYMQQWLQKKKIELKPTSYTRVLATVNKHIIPYIGHIPIQNLTDGHIQDLVINRMFEDGLKHSSIQKAYQSLNNCITYAIKRRDLTYNPMGVVALPPKHKFKTKDEELKYFTESDMETFIQTALTPSLDDEKMYNYRYGPMFVLMLNTGIRSGEARALKVQDCDLTNNTLSIHSNVVDFFDIEAKQMTRYIQESTKTEAGTRTVTLVGYAVSMATILTMNKEAKDLLLSTPDGKPISTSNFERSFKTIVKKAGLVDDEGNPKYTGLHTLRHTYASFMFRNKIDIKIISHQLGHADVSTTYNIYTHIINANKIDEIAQMNSLSNSQPIRKKENTMYPIGIVFEDD